MKSMTCRELGGACDAVFRAATFEEMAELSKRHAMEMFTAGDEAHLRAAAAMQELMSDPVAFQAWFEERRRSFEDRPAE